MMGADACVDARFARRGLGDFLACRSASFEPEREREKEREREREREDS